MGPEPRLPETALLTRRDRPLRPERPGGAAGAERGRGRSEGAELGRSSARRRRDRAHRGDSLGDAVPVQRWASPRSRPGSGPPPRPAALLGSRRLPAARGGGGGGLRGRARPAPRLPGQRRDALAGAGRGVWGAPVMASLRTADSRLRSYFKENYIPQVCEVLEPAAAAALEQRSPKTSGRRGGGWARPGAGVERAGGAAPGADRLGGQSTGRGARDRNREPRT